ncbi:efflux RND transporter periplasmic adaptor subunit [Qipengyuania sp.]|uniref:efflux RND transporter periplasmic adaptor subunit n=1 Tax=Qipengyuania sp. TaxID=2004515 RepID=UPI0035C81967
MTRLFAALMGGLFLVSCSGSEAPPQPAAVPVQTITMRAVSVPNVMELPGRVEAFKTAEVRARVTGIIQSRLYDEGTDVGAGQLLFRIDPSELRASYAQAQAALARARASASNARAVVERYRPLVSENAISRQEYDAAVAAAREADANVNQLAAQLRAADLQLGYTTVRAPIAGRAGRAETTEGALVSQAEGTLLTRIEQISRVYVRFSQSSDELMALRRQASTGEISLGPNDRMEVLLSFKDGSEYPVPGYIDFQGRSVDAETGTVELRAIFPNPSGLLLPGEFVRAKIIAGQISNGIAVPQRAVSLSEQGGSVFIVSKDGKAAVRPVTLGAMIDGKWIVESGLKAGDVVIVSNLQKLRPGVPVQRIGSARKAQANTPAPAKEG